MIQIVLKCKNLFHELVFPTDSIEEGSHLSLQEIQPPSRTFSGSVPHSISWGGSVVLTSLRRLQWRTEASWTRSKCHSPPGFFSVGEFPTYCDLLTVTFNGLSERGNTPSLIAILQLCEAKTICGTPSPRVTALALFYESVKGGTETKEIETTTTTTNWTTELKPQATNPSKLDTICAQDVWKFIFMLNFSVFRTSKGNFPYKVY